MKRLLSAILCAAVLAVFPVGGAWAEAPETFEFPGGITWESTPEEVEAILGEGCRSNSYDTSSMFPPYPVLEIENSEFFGLPCRYAQFWYSWHESYAKLLGIICFYDTKVVASAEDLLPELCTLYGESARYYAETYEPYIQAVPYQYEGRCKEVCSWTLSGHTVISIFDFGDQKTYRYAVVCLNGDGMNESASLPD